MIVVLLQCCPAIAINNAYWLWAGITAKDAPPMKDYYIYQGIISQQGNKVHLQHIGLYPHPISCSQCFLVYRFASTLPSQDGFVKIFLDDAKKWQRHHVSIRGLQVDYDSPTKKLISYADYLIKLRQALPGEYELNITGLADWLTDGDKVALTKIAENTSHVAYQLYNGRHPLKNNRLYISALDRYPHPFRLGLLQEHLIGCSLKKLKYNPNFLGITYFIQKE